MSLPRRQYWFNASLQNRSRAGPSIKTTRQIAPPGIGRAEWLWQQLHYSRSHIAIFASCDQSQVGSSDWQYTGLADNLSQIGWHLLSKWIHSEVCLPMMIWVLKHVTNDSPGPGDWWPLHTWPLAPSARVWVLWLMWAQSPAISYRLSIWP